MTMMKKEIDEDLSWDKYKYKHNMIASTAHWRWEVNETNEQMQWSVGEEGEAIRLGRGAREGRGEGESRDWIL